MKGFFHHKTPENPIRITGRFLPGFITGQSDQFGGDSNGRLFGTW
jgi:hypothetical protein